MSATIKAIAALLLLSGVSCVVQADDFMLLGTGGSGNKPAIFGLKNKTSTSVGGVVASATLTGTTAGNFIIVGAGWCQTVGCFPGSNSPITSVVSSNSGGGEVCHQVSGAYDTSTAWLGTDVWYCPNIVGGSDTITVTASGGQSLQIGLSEWTGISNSAPLDTISNDAFNNANVNSASVSTNGTTAQASELIYTPLYVPFFSSQTASAGQILLNTQQNFYDFYQVSGVSGGTYTNTAAWTGTAHPWGASIAAFKHP